jgi:antitoxin ChpS
MAALTAAKTKRRPVVTRAKLKQSGGSLIFTVPAPARKAMYLNAGDEVDVIVDNGRLVLEPVVPAVKAMRVRRPKYTLDELIEGYDADAPLTDEERAWMDAPPAGRELW